MAFEELVSRIQQQIDPNSKVNHNELLEDRLGHKRQFDVVIRGFAFGQELLGVIECKDLKRNVGVQDVEAFATKCVDINANLKILVSRRGFTRKAIEKARHHGIQTLSLLPEQASGVPSPLATKWYADLYYWSKLVVNLHHEGASGKPDEFDPDELRIQQRPVIDWFKSYLIKHHPCAVEEGWLTKRVDFAKPQQVTAGDRLWNCTGITFAALRTCVRKSKPIGVSGRGFYDWQRTQIKLPSNSTLSTYPVPLDFVDWDDRGSEPINTQSVLYGHFTVHMKSFEMPAEAIDLELL